MATSEATNLHFKVQNISRRSGKRALASAAYRSGTRLQRTISVVARAAYRSGESLHDRRADTTYDFRRKEQIEHTGIYAHSARPEWAVQRGDLWNAVENIERRKDARLAKDITAALPRELSLEQQIALAEAFVQQEFVCRGYVVDIAIHTKQASDGGENPHMHIMVPTRMMTAEGFAGRKDRDLDTPETLRRWRRTYEALCNRFLEDAGSGQRVSLSSYKARGLDKIPGVHIGHEAWNLEKRGIETSSGNINRSVRHFNHLRDLLRQQGLDAVPVAKPVTPVKPPNARGLAELARPNDTSNGGGGRTDHNRHMIKTLARSLMTPVAQARLSALRQLNRLRSWWEERRQERQTPPKQTQQEAAFDRQSSGNLGRSARLLATEKEKDKEYER